MFPKFKVLVCRAINSVFSKKSNSFVYLRRIFFNFTSLFESEVKVIEDYEAIVFSDPSPTLIDLSHGFSSRNIFEIHNAIIDPLTGQVFVKSLANEFTLIAESSSWDPSISLLRLRNRDSTYRRNSLGALSFDTQTFAISPFPSANGYYHWLIEDLPAYLRVHKNFPKSVFITGGKLSHRSCEVLRALDSEYILSETYVASNIVHFAERGHEKALAHPSDLELLTELGLKMDQSNNKAKLPTITFLQRGTLDEKGRSLDISNSNLFLLDNFLSINPEHLKLVDLIALLTNTVTIIGFHGGGLANIAWVNNIQNCIEIVFDNFSRGLDAIKWICTVKGINHFRITINSSTSKADLVSQVILILNAIE